MQNQITLSIILPIFNHADLVIEMIQSIQQNSFSDWELIAIDDGSEESNFKTIADFVSNDSRITYIKREILPKGAQTCRNLGFERAKGKYVCFFDSDDYVTPFCFEQRVEEMEANPDMDFMVFRSASYKDSKFSTAASFNIYGYPIFKDDIAAFCKRQLPFIVWNNIYKRNSLIKFKAHWDTKLLSLQDADFNLKCILAGMKYCYSSRPADYAYRHGVVGSISKKINTIQHVNSCLHAVSSFYENVRAKYPNQYNHALYQGAINIYVRIIRRGFDKNFNASLIRIVKKHTPFWGTILQLQISITTLLSYILPKNVARRIPILPTLFSERLYERRWKPQMLKRFLLPMLALLPVLSSCAQKTDARNHQYELAWHDEFNADSLNNTLWTKMPRINRIKNYKHFSEDARLYQFKDGFLRLYAFHNSDFAPLDTAEYLTAGIQSEGKATFTYGKIEVRVRIHGAQGTWPAIWTLPINNEYRTIKSPYYTELDILEYVDNNKFVYQTAHNAYTLRNRKNWYNPQHQQQSKIKFEKFNTYSVEILLDEIIFGINGRETLRYPKLKDEPHQFHYGIESFIMLHMQVDPPKSWSEGIDPKTFPAYMDIDWVRVYKLKDL